MDWEIKKGSPAVLARLPRLLYHALGFASAPLTVNLVGVPDTAILVPAFHLTFVDGGPGLVTLLNIFAVAIVAVVGILLDFIVLAIATAIEGVWFATVLKQVSDGAVSSLQQLRTFITTQGNLALEAIGVDIASVPGSGGFTEGQLVGQYSFFLFLFGSHLNLLVR